MAAPPGNWRQDILGGIKAPVTPANLRFLDAWQRAEGGTYANNPFNTTLRTPAQVGPPNSAGVRGYASPQAGVQATVNTLLSGRYGNIVGALRQGTNAKAAADALAASPWGTGSLVQKILGSGGGAPSGGAPVSTVPLGGVPSFRAPQLGGDPIAAALVSTLGQSPEVVNQALMGASLSSPTAVEHATRPVKSSITSQGVPFEIEGRASKRALQAVNLAENYLGTPYVWGGSKPGGFDCSGLLQYVWAQRGVQIPRTTYDQVRAGAPVARSQLQPGDAVFFTGSDPMNGLPGHVGMYIGGGKFIEAPHTGASVRISELAGRRDFAGARRYG